MARVAALVIASMLWGTVATAVPARKAEMIIDAQTPKQQEMAEWALGRYEAAGLELPSLIIDFAGRDTSECRGAAGSVYLDRAPIVVKLCWDDRFVLLHELAHVWAADNIPAAKHEPFMAMRTDAVSWGGAEVVWEQRGKEHAANVIAWGVLEDPFPISRTYPNDPDSLRSAFEFLTGTHPLHDGGPEIQQPDRQFFSAHRTSTPLESGR